MEQKAILNEAEGQGKPKEKKAGSTKENLQAVQVPGFHPGLPEQVVVAPSPGQDSGCLRLSLCPTHFFCWNIGGSWLMSVEWMSQ